MRPRFRRERAKCPKCGRVMAVQPPKGGDGSVDVFRRHYRYGTTGAKCPESRMIVRSQDYVRDDA